MTTYRQGDIILAALSEQDTALLLSHTTDLVTETLSMKGETGKTHEITGRVVQNGNGTVLVLQEPTPIVHEQHGQLVIPRGAYSVTRVREWTGQTTRNSMD